MMIDHVSIRVSDLDRSRNFYEPLLGVLGYKCLGEVEEGVVGFVVDHAEDDHGSFWIIKEDYLTQSVHVAFSAKTQELVEQFFKEGLQAGGRDNGAPGLRPEYGETYFGAFVLDPDGNNIEATCYLPKKPL